MRISTALACTVLLLANAHTARAAGVVGTGTADSCTEAALDAALDGGGLVTFDCGPEAVTITITQQKTISSDTTVDGGGLVTLDGNDAVRAFWVAQGQALTVENLAIVKGNATDAGGGAIFNDGGTLTVTNSTFTDNASSTSSLGGTLTVTDSTFTGNTASAIANAAGATATVTNSTFTDNHSNDLGGGGIANRGTLTVANSTFTGNGVGAIYNGGTEHDPHTGSSGVSSPRNVACASA